MKTIIEVTFIGLLLVGTAGCNERQGTMESAGKRTDEIIDNVAEGENPLKKKGPLEQAGEELDEAARRARESVDRNR